MQAETHEPSQQSVWRAASSSERPRARQTFLGADGDMKGHAIKPFPGDTKIISCTFQLPEQQSPEKQALWESLSSLFLGIINRITAARPFNGLRLNSGPGGRPAPCTTAGHFLTNQHTRCSGSGNQEAPTERCLSDPAGYEPADEDKEAWGQASRCEVSQDVLQLVSQRPEELLFQKAARFLSPPKPAACSPGSVSLPKRLALPFP